MNTKRVDAAAGVIHAAMQQGKSLPQTLAYDLEAAQLLQSPGRAAELTARRNEDMSLRDLLVDARRVPFELGTSLVPAVRWLIARVVELSAVPPATVWVAECDSVETEVYSTLEGARACCDDIARAVAGGQCWDWSVNEDGVHVQHWTHADDDRPAGATGGTVAEVRVQYPEGVERVDEVARLRARVSELEQERHSTNEVLSDAAEALRVSRDRIAALEAERSRPAPVLPAASPSCTAPHSPSCSCASGEYRFCGASLGRDEFPFTCHRRVAHKGRCSGELDPEPVEDSHGSPAWTPGRLRSIENVAAEAEGTFWRRLGVTPPADTREEPHDSPLHHEYKTGRDLPLPEVPRG